MKSKVNKPFNTFFLQTTGIVFVSQLVTLILFYGMNILGLQLQFFNLEQISPLLVMSIILIISAGVGVGISFLLAKKLTDPLKKLKKASDEIAKGNFNVNVDLNKQSVLNEFIQDFNGMAQELKSIETLKSDFISNVSHEFKTPLAVIQSYSKALRRKDLDDETRKKYEKVLDNNILKLTTLTSNILNLSKIENQKMLADKTNFLLDEQIRQCILSLEPEWQQKNIEFDLELPRTLYRGSKELMTQVWQNLIGNAIKFSHNGGKITVSITKLENKIQVTIADEGIGMNEETLKHLYDKFYQGDNSHSASGNGLGLALVKRIIAISRGEISVTSKKGKGSIFTVTL